MESLSRVECQSPHGSPQASGRVLASGTAGGKRIEMVEHEDGTFALRIEGSELPQFQWPQGQVESCAQAYLRLVQP